MGHRIEGSMARTFQTLCIVATLGLCACQGGSIAAIDEGSTGTSGSGTSQGTTGESGGSSGTTGVDGAECSACTVATDCGEEGLAVCEPQAEGGSACLFSCVDDFDCDAAAHCDAVQGELVCVPNTGGCAGYEPEGPRDGGGDPGDTGSSGSSDTGSSGSGSTAGTSGSTGSQSSSSSGSTGTTTQGSTASSTSGSSGSTGVTLQGGTVNRLHFLITGDTRPPQCGATSNYPTAIIRGIADAATSHHAQFAVDMGDHMFVCDGSTSAANAQMTKYTNAIARFANPWFMTEGNHECMGTGSNSGHCTSTSQNANYLAYMNALNRTHPYYKVNIHTSQGLATFVFVADNSWSTAQETWLKSTLTTADANAKYTIVVKHHPSGNTSVAANATITNIINQHKYTLLLTGHIHHYSHPHPREIVLGTGGAHLTTTSDYFGYAIVDQKANGNLGVKVYDLNTGAAMDSWSVTPQ